jgi:cytochrome b
MTTVKQTTRLIAWVIAGLIMTGILLYSFGPAALRTDEVVVIGLLVLGLIWFQAWLRRRGV